MTELSFTTGRGIGVHLEEDHSLPLVDVELIVRRGATVDPAGFEGLTRLTARLMRRGPRGVRAEAFDERLDALGSTLGVGVQKESVRFHGTVLARNLRPFLEAFGAMVLRPALRRDDFARVRRKTLADLRALRDRDQALAARAFRRALFRRHPYGRPVGGSPGSVGALKLADVRRHHERLIRAPQLTLGFAGAVTEEELRPLVEQVFAPIELRAEPPPRPRAARTRAGRHVVLVDKPSRTQTQLYVGSLGVQVGDAHHTAATVANTAFGVMFTSRLVREVRSERGWSYGVHSHLGADRQRESWSMWTHPAAEQVLACLELELSLVEQWCREGLSARELRAAKRYLTKGHAFDRETAFKRLHGRLEAALYGLPEDWPRRFPARVRAVTRRSAREAVRQFLDPSRLTISLVATRTPELERGLRALPGVRSLEVRTYTEV